MINDNGFTRPTYDELVKELGLKWRELFGENAQISTRSVGGILIRVLAYIMDKLYQLAEVVYNSQFVDSASGTTLDQLAANVGLSRLPAQTGIGSIKIWGQAGYIVPSGTLFKTSDDLMYVTTEDIELKDTGEKTMSIEKYGTIQAMSGNVGIGESRLLYANSLGETYNKDGLYVLKQVTPVEAVMYAQLSDVTGGADIEKDDALRKRVALSNSTVPSSPYNGILSGVSKVTGVKTVKIIPNETMEDDPDTNTPAKSLHIYVDGGFKDDVGKSIFDTVAAGIRTVGEQKVSIVDIAGISHDVFFDRPTNKPIYVSVSLQKNDSYPFEGDKEIKRLIKEYVESVGMGNTLYYTKLYELVYKNVPGIVVADIKVGLDSENVAAQDIQLKKFETAELADNGVIIE